MLSPLLFNIYVNDMPIQINSTVLTFADDLKMFRVIHRGRGQLLNDIRKLLARVAIEI